MGVVGFGYDHYAGGVFVEAMDDAGTHVTVYSGQFVEIIHEAVYKGSVGVAPCGVDDYISLLVYCDEFIVFVNYVDRDVFWYDLAYLSWREYQVDLIAGIELAASFGGTAVDIYALLLDELLQSASAELVESAA